MPLIDEALQISQDHGLAIIACGDDKAPIHSGWREKASADPDKIREMFSDPKAKLVGVPMGGSNDLIAFDIDFREGNTTERNAKLTAITEELRDAYPNQIRIHRTRNGGLHMIMLEPTGKAKIPRNLMPKLEMVFEGFQIIWPTEGSGYTVEVDVLLDDLAEPDRKFLKIREKMEGISSAGGLMTAELAHQVMMTDGEVGTRHDALLRMTQDWANKAPADWADDKVCGSFEAWFRTNYGDAIETTRLDELMNWRWEYGELMGSDLGNAMKGALLRATDRKAEAMVKLEQPASIFETPHQEMPVEDAQEQAEAIVVEAPPEPSFTMEAPEMLPPPRQWLLGKKVERGQLSVVQAPPGSGKTAVVIATAMSMASGTQILFDDTPAGPQKVVYWNGEDTSTEIGRRIVACAQVYKLTSKNLETHLRVISTQATPLHLVIYDEGHPSANPAVVAALKDSLADFDADVLVIDPLATIHGVDASRSVEMKMVRAILGTLARELGIAIVLVTHGDKDGAGVFQGSARHVTTLKPMDGVMGNRYSIHGSQWHRYLRLTTSKSNNEAQPIDRWIELSPVNIGNGDDTYSGGDRVAVAQRWDVRTDNDLVTRMATAIELLRHEWTRDVAQEADRLVREDKQARNHWFGAVLSDAFELPWRRGEKVVDLNAEEQMNRQTVVDLIDALVEQKLITKTTCQDDKYRDRPAWKVDENRVDLFMRGIAREDEK